MELFPQQRIITLQKLSYLITICYEIAEEFIKS